MPIFRLDDDDIRFPDPRLADDGIIAVGGDLSEERLIEAYRSGIFPWFNPGEPYVWWSPDPRFVLYPSELKVSKSMRPYFNQKKFRVSYDHNFLDVILACKTQNREGQQGTWITHEMVEAYHALHQRGVAHSVEVWGGDELVGGLYGVALGKVFFGESMFSKKSNASKFGFISLVRDLRVLGCTMVDCQQETRHLASLGARSISREDFLKHLEENKAHETISKKWAEAVSI